MNRKFNNPKNDIFDWGLYEDGYNGKNLVKNSKFKTPKGTTVYCHEPYAEELYEMYTGAKPVSSLVAKDLIPGTLMQVTDIHPVGSKFSKTEIIVDTANGGSCRVDLNKEREFINMYTNATPEMIVNSLCDSEFKDEFLSLCPVVKVLDRNRVSLWGGHIGTIEESFNQQLKLKQQDTVYQATVVSTNGGGYIVDIAGLKCFMPGSLAAAGIITDFAALIGKTIPVMAEGYIPGKGYVVSYKKYLSAMLPTKVQEELSVNMKVKAKVTGLSKNGVFVQFNDKDGEPTFIGLIYRDEMTPHMEDLLDEGEIMAGDEIISYIHSIENDGKRPRIVLGDTPTDDPVFVAKKESLRNSKK